MDADQIYAKCKEVDKQMGQGGTYPDLAMQKGLYFLDSRTTSQTQARQAALELDTHIIERNAPFLI